MAPGVIFLGLLVLALAGCAAGALLTVRSLAGDKTVMRRLARAAPARIESNEAQPSTFERQLDRHAPWLRRRLIAAGAPLQPTQVALGALGLTGLFLVGGAAAHLSPLLTLMLALWGGLAGPYALIGWMAARRRKQFIAQMPQAIDLIARSLQAGHPVSTAMSVAAQQMADPMGPEFAVVISEMRAGLDRDAALRNLLQRFPIPELRMFAASLEVTRETGGNLAEVFLKLGESIRAKAQLRKKVMAISAEGRLSFWVVSALPVLVFGAIMALRPQYYGEVMHDPLFWPLMCVPPVELAVGAIAIWRMVNFRI